MIGCCSVREARADLVRVGRADQAVLVRKVSRLPEDRVDQAPVAQGRAEAPVAAVAVQVEAEAADGSEAVADGSAVALVAAADSRGMRMRSETRGAIDAANIPATSL